MLYDTQFPLFNKEMTRAEFDSKVQENPLNEHLKVDEIQPEEKAVEYDIGMGYLGNGLTVWNRAVEVNGDYQNIAHISPEGEITFYVQDLPQSVVERIEQAAEREKPRMLLCRSSIRRILRPKQTIRVAFCCIRWATSLKPIPRTLRS